MCLHLRGVGWIGTRWGDGHQRARFTGGGLDRAYEQVSQHIVGTKRREGVVQRLGNLGAKLLSFATAAFAPRSADEVARIDAVLGTKLGAELLSSRFRQWFSLHA